VMLNCNLSILHSNTFEFFKHPVVTFTKIADCHLTSVMNQTQAQHPIRNANRAS